MKRAQTIWQNPGDPNHRWVAVSRDRSVQMSRIESNLISTTEYLVQSGAQSLLVDPGGAEVFPSVFAALAEVCDVSKISALFASHQDPDVISSMALWLAFNSRLRCYVSWLWASFIPHFGGEPETFIRLPDEGADIQLDGRVLRAVPAHFLHSSGNFHLYDPQARILFSGDVGAALLPSDEEELFVTDFDRHIRYATTFHKRWMGSQIAKNRWCERVSGLEIDMLCPQHGAIYKGKDVQRFLGWFHSLEVGVLGSK